VHKVVHVGLVPLRCIRASDYADVNLGVVVATRSDLSGVASAKANIAREWNARDVLEERRLAGALVAYDDKLLPVSIVRDYVWRNEMRAEDLPAVARHVCQHSWHEAGRSCAARLGWPDGSAWAEAAESASCRPEVQASAPAQVVMGQRRLGRGWSCASWASEKSLVR
jgi:hypothetical protein